MNNFRDGRSRDRRDSFRRDSGRSSSRREMFDAVCDNCGKDCKVPFRPSGDKPIYCSDCFEKMGGQGARNDRRGPRRDSARSDSPSQRGGGDQAMTQLSKNIETLNTKLDSIITLLSANQADSKPEPVKVEEKNEVKEKEVKVKKESIKADKPKEAKVKKAPKSKAKKTK